MTNVEVSKLLKVVLASYPRFFESFDTEKLAYLKGSWLAVMSDYTYEQGAAGLKTFIASDTKGFPPSPGQVIAHITRMTHPGQLQPLEAWALVRMALRNSAYNSEEEFTKLPEAVQRALGSHTNLQAMAAMDSATVNSVEQSHFLRSYEAVVRREEEDAKIPASVKALYAKSTPAIKAEPVEAVEMTGAPEETEDYRLPDFVAAKMREIRAM